MVRSKNRAKVRKKLIQKIIIYLKDHGASTSKEIAIGLSSSSHQGFVTGEISQVVRSEPKRFRVAGKVHNKPFSGIVSLWDLV
jgi:predicted transcriptional regulator with HTH domain